MKLSLASLIAFVACKQPPQTDKLDDTMRRMSKEAVIQAKERYSVVLNNEFSSLLQVDSILGLIHEQHKAVPLPEQRLNVEAFMWGSYVGEVLKTKKAFHWERDSEFGKDTFPLVAGKGNMALPCAWCYKRIVNGAEDGICFKAEFFVSDELRNSAK